MTRIASCNCGQLRAEVEGDPVRVSVCHCLACQVRTGSAFGVQARFHPDQVRVTGRRSRYVRRSDEDGEERRYDFCPDCGATVTYSFEGVGDIVVVPVGAFADPGFPVPTREIYDDRRHPWVHTDITPPR